MKNLWQLNNSYNMQYYPNLMVNKYLTLKRLTRFQAQWVKLVGFRCMQV